MGTGDSERCMSQLARTAGKPTVIRGRGLFRGTVAGVVLLGGATVLAFLLQRQGNSVFVGGIAVSFGCWLLWTIGISGKVVVSDDGIKVDNFFISHFIAWQDFDSFVLDSGIWLTKRDGSRVWLIGFGGSLIGALTGYRSMRKSLVILQEAGSRHREAAGSANSRDRVRLGLPVLAGWLIVLEAAALIGRALH
jgi:hypothetical protein